jgi:hypothetical protein
VSLCLRGKFPLTKTNKKPCKKQEMTYILVGLDVLWFYEIFFKEVVSFIVLLKGAKP